MVRVRNSLVSLAVAGALGLVSAAASASPIVSYDTQSASSPAPASFIPNYTVSSTDLLNGATPSTTGSGNFALESSGGTPVLTDAQFQAIGNGSTGTHPAFATA